MPEPRSTERVFDGAFLRVDREGWPQLDAPWEIARRHEADAAAVLPVTPDGDVLLVRQFRAAARTELLEIPAGLVEAGEDPAMRAAEELREETGYTHTSIEPIGDYLPSPGSWAERVHLFLAETEARPAGRPEAGIVVVPRRIAEVVADVRAGRIPDMKTALAVLLADARRAAG
jgi:ADP-ribose pyrophosphatase